MAETTAMGCRNVQAVLEAAGSGMARVVMVGVRVFPFFAIFFSSCLGLGFGWEGRG